MIITKVFGEVPFNPLSPYKPFLYNSREIRIFRRKRNPDKAVDYADDG